jgi:hypothetical protein
VFFAFLGNGEALSPSFDSRYIPSVKNSGISNPVPNVSVTIPINRRMIPQKLSGAPFGAEGKVSLIHRSLFRHLSLSRMEIIYTICYQLVLEWYQAAGVIVRRKIYSIL